MMIMAAAFGLYGVILFYIAINVHLAGLRSFKSFYLSPFAPFYGKGFLDVFIRAPLILQTMRNKEPRSLDHQKLK